MTLPDGWVLTSLGEISHIQSGAGFPKSFQGKSSGDFPSVAQKVEAAVSAGLRRANRLRQAILKRAFEGRLVEHNPGDEPAEKLLKKFQSDQLETEMKAGDQLEFP